MVVRPDGTKYEPSVWDIDDSEPTPKEIVGNWLAMGVAMGVVVILSPFFVIAGLILYWKGDAELLSQATEPSLSGVHRARREQESL